MGSRKSDPVTRAALIEIAARLLSQEGPQALTARRVATESGKSTMGVYTHFGSMRGLVKEIVDEGFSRLQRQLTSLPCSDDPVADIALLGRAYRHNAVTNPHLYAVMFGGMTLAGFSLSEHDRQHGRYTLSNVVECAHRCLDAGRFEPADAELIAHQMWIATHGLVTLELGDYFVAPWDVDRCFESQLVSLMVSVGDTREAAIRSVALSCERFQAHVLGAG